MPVQDLRATPVTELPPLRAVSGDKDLVAAGRFEPSGRQASGMVRHFSTLGLSSTEPARKAQGGLDNQAFC